MQDNAPVHTARVVSQWFNDAEIGELAYEVSRLQSN